MEERFQPRLGGGEFFRRKMLGPARALQRHFDEFLDAAEMAESTRMRSARKIASSTSCVMKMMVMSTFFQISSR
jgi:hypothetical protein